MMRSTLYAGAVRSLAAFALSAVLAGCSVSGSASVPAPHQVGPGGLNVTPSDVSMSPGDVATVSASENGYSGTFNEADTCAGIATVTAVSASQYSVTAVAPGICSITVSDSNGHSGQVAVSIQTIIIGGH
jgi:hypothetical protein